MSRPKVLLIYTGGTIGMIKDPETGQLSNVDFNLIYEHVPELNRIDVDLDTISVKQPIDSSEIVPSNWVELASLIESNYKNYDGFVVLHGSDTMAYTASALSFMFKGLKKPVILTGSQLPIGVIRTDGKENIITAIEIAATQEKDGEPLIQEVAVYFDYQLFRGNRSTKDSAENFEAFRSPNYPTLAVAGVNINYAYVNLYRSSEETFQVQKGLTSDVAILKLFPGIKAELYTPLFDITKTKGVVIESFGAGNALMSDVLKSLIKSYIDARGIVLNITQCNSGSVKQGMYQASSVFNELGVISGGDMTSEAAITKMMTCLHDTYQDDKIVSLARSIRGERTNS